MARSIVCFRYLLTASFLILGISGVVICGTGSYFVHRLHGSLTKPEWYGPPVLLLITGIINIVLGPYFWFCFDTKYNRPQLFLFFTIVVLVAIIEAAAGLWAIVDHGKVDTAIAKILEKKLASVPFDKVGERSTWNVTAIKIKCCGFENFDNNTENKEQLDEASRTTDEGDEMAWSCCDTTQTYSGKEYNDSGIDETCADFYVTACRDLALHRYRSVLVYTFVVAICATILQILESIGLQAYNKSFAEIKRRPRVLLRTPSQRYSTRITCPVAPLGPQHVCEGCSSGQHYHE